jgi:hypothetical protein
VCKIFCFAKNTWRCFPSRFSLKMNQRISNFCKDILCISIMWQCLCLGELPPPHVDIYSLYKKNLAFLKERDKRFCSFSTIFLCTFVFYNLTTMCVCVFSFCFSFKNALNTNKKKWSNKFEAQTVASLFFFTLSPKCG